MKTFRSFLLAALLPVTAAVAQQTNDASAAGPDSLLEAVRGASDPSAAIEAYARASAAGTIAPVQLERVYLQHMVDHGAPELADFQAHDLIRHGAADATVRGVAAYNDATRGNLREALRNLKFGLIERPADPFLLRTAGQIVAWYDAQIDRSALSREDVASIEWLRNRGKNRPEFVEAYQSAFAARRAAANEATRTTPTSPTPGSTTQAPTAGSEGSGGNTGNGGGNDTGGGNGGGYGSTGTTYYYYYPYYGYGYGSAYSLIALRERAFHRDRPGLDPANPPIRPGDAGSPPRGPSQAPPAPTQAPPRPQQAPASPPQAPPRAPLMPPRPPLPPGPPHP